jgi:purine-binding chemotaxis protein CheW
MSTLYLLFRLAGETYAISGTLVREVFRWHEPTPVPGALPALSGIVNQRGTILPIIDLRMLFGCAPAEVDQATRMVAIHYETIDAALQVDAVLDLLEFAPDQHDGLPPGIPADRVSLLRGILHHNDEMIAVIDIAALLTALQARA